MWKSVPGKLRDELLNAEVFNTLLEACVLIEQWRVHYNLDFAQTRCGTLGMVSYHGA